MTPAHKLKPRTSLQAHLERLGACADAREWTGSRDLETAWAECPDGRWSLWLAARCGVDRRLVVEAACRCAEAVSGLVPEGEKRPRKAIETARAWIHGEASLEEVMAGARAAYDAAYAAARAAEAATGAAARAAALAAEAATGAAAHAAAHAVGGSNAGAAAHAAGAARLTALADCADLVRQVITAADVAEALESDARGRQ